MPYIGDHEDALLLTSKVKTSSFLDASVFFREIIRIDRTYINPSSHSRSPFPDAALGTSTTN
jgi:hypothetical protein